MNYLQLFKDYNIPMDYNRLKSDWINVLCPYCGSTSFHLGFNIKSDYCSCFKCGGHNLLMTLSKILNVSSNIVTEICDSYQTRNMIIAKLNDKEKPNKEKINLPGFPLSTTEKKYLLNRHFYPNDLMKTYNIQGGGYYGEWKNRIIIPIYVGGKLVSWTSRTIISDREPRYKTLPNQESVINIKKIFFNLDNCTHDYVLLLEGPFDVMRFGNDSICGFGMQLSRTQLIYLAERFKKVFICFDNERIAKNKAHEYSMLLCGYGIESYEIDISDYNVNDVGELSPYKIKQFRKFLFNREGK